MAFMPRATLVVVMSFLGAACAIAPIPIDNLAYQGPTTARSSRDARLTIISSNSGTTTITRLMPAGGALIAMPESTRQAPFGPADQSEFARSLNAELVRLGMVRSVTAEAAAPSDLDIALSFDHSTFKVDMVEYQLFVTLKVTAGGQVLQTRHHVNSAERDSLLERINTNGAQARFKAATLLLEKVLTDIDAFLLTLPPGGK